MYIRIAVSRGRRGGRGAEENTHRCIGMNTCVPVSVPNTQLWVSYLMQASGDNRPWSARLKWRKTERESSRLSNVQFISESCDNQNWVQTVQGKHLQGTWQKALAELTFHQHRLGELSPAGCPWIHIIWEKKWLGRDFLSPRRTAILEEQRTLSISFLLAPAHFLGKQNAWKIPPGLVNTPCLLTERVTYLSVLEYAFTVCTVGSAVQTSMPLGLVFRQGQLKQGPRETKSWAGKAVFSSTVGTKGGEITKGQGLEKVQALSGFWELIHSPGERPEY